MQLYEVEEGVERLTIVPRERRPVIDYLSRQGRFAHLQPEHIAKIQQYADWRCAKWGIDAPMVESRVDGSRWTPNPEVARVARATASRGSSGAPPPNARTRTQEDREPQARRPVVVRLPGVPAPKPPPTSVNLDSATRLV